MNTRNSSRTPMIESLEARQLMAGQTVFYENFESGGRGWSNDTELATDQGKAWAVESGRAHSGTRAAGTVNAGYDSVLASPAINLPAVDQYREHLYLKWWQTVDYKSRGGFGVGTPVVREWVPELGTWGPWNVIDPNTAVVGTDVIRTWGNVGLDLTQFAGGRVQVGFHHNGFANGATGWTVDDVTITKEQVQRPWAADTSFSGGFDGWTTNRGMWDVAGGVAGTALHGTPPVAYDSSLISPAFYLSAGAKNGPVSLEFKSFMDRRQSAVITVEFQFWMPSTGWSPVNNVSADLADTVLNFHQPEGQWKTFRLPLTNSLGGAVNVPHRLLFTATSGIVGGGWKIDDVKLNFPGKGTQPTPTPTTKRPEVAVFNPFGELTDGVTSVRWGTYSNNTGGRDVTFTVRNTGTATLQLGPVSVTGSSAFVVVAQPAKAVNPGQATTFKIRLLTSTVGAKSAVVKFATNDLDEGVFDFAIGGVVK
ncbi:MAG TPA: hypothetical protein VF796_00230 [Humisphaera sp.]